LREAIVALERARSYDEKTIRTAVRRLWDQTPGAGDLVKRGQRVLIKINHLGQHARESAINTDCAVTGAVAEILMESGGTVTVGDGLNISGHAPFEKSGYVEVAKRYGFALANFKDDDYVEVANPLGGKLRSFHIARAVVEADVLVNVAKLKTHVLTLYTGAVKNSYGYLPMRLRQNLHKQFPIPREFARGVVEIFCTRIPAINILDGIVALAGQGPSRGGRPYLLGGLAASRDAVALDAVACRLVGLAPEIVPTLTYARDKNVGVIERERISCVGETPESLTVKDFPLPSTSALLTFLDSLPAPAARALERILLGTREVPVIRRIACIGCGLCARHCPRHAIRMEAGQPIIDYAECISCFCCQEFCESDAIALRRSVVIEFGGQCAAVLRGTKRAVRRARRRKPG